MPMKLLRELAQLPLPLTLTEPADVDRARVLMASDHIACTISGPRNPEPFARVLAITKEGHAALALEEVLRRRKA